MLVGAPYRPINAKFGTEMKDDGSVSLFIRYIFVFFLFSSFLYSCGGRAVDSLYGLRHRCRHRQCWYRWLQYLMSVRPRNNCKYCNLCHRPVFNTTKALSCAYCKCLTHISCTRFSVSDCVNVQCRKSGWT